MLGGCIARSRHDEDVVAKELHRTLERLCRAFAWFVPLLIRTSLELNVSTINITAEIDVYRVIMTSIIVD